MLNFQLANKYARAFFEIALEDKKLDSAYKDLAKINDEIFSIPDAVSFFQNPLVPKDAKKDLLLKSLKKDVSDTTLNFLNLLVDKGRIGIFSAIYEIFSALKNDAQGILIADVTTAFPLSRQHESLLIKKISALTNKKIRVRKHEDSKILGGIILTIGDKRIDGSVAGRLRSLKHNLSTDSI